jgi:hypothetical protein
VQQQHRRGVIAPTFISEVNRHSRDINEPRGRRCPLRLQGFDGLIGYAVGCKISNSRRSDHEQPGGHGFQDEMHGERGVWIGLPAADVELQAAAAIAAFTTRA